jgi:hypothetical protein
MRVRKAGWGAVAGPRATVPSLTRNVLPGQASSRLADSQVPAGA